MDSKKQLLRLKGKNRIFVRQMDVSPTSLNRGDTFILDGGKKMFLWLGRESNPRERNKGQFFVKKLNEERGSPILFLGTKTNSTVDSKCDQRMVKRRNLKWKSFGLH